MAATSLILGAVPLALIDHYVALEPIIYPLKIIAAGVQNIMQFLGITILTYFTDLPESASRLLKNLPRGTILPEIDCVSTKNLLGTKNVKAAIVGAGDSDAYADGKGGISWWNRKEMSYNAESSSSYKDYLWYLLYTFLVLIFAFGLLCYFFPGPGPDSPGNVGNVGDVGDADSNDGTVTSSAFWLALSSKLWRLKKAVFSIFTAKESSPARETGFKQIRPTDSELDITNSPEAFHHYFQERMSAILTTPIHTPGDKALRALEIDRLERLGLNYAGYEFKVDEFGIGQYWINYNGERRLFWEEVPGHGYRMIKMDLDTGHDIYDQSGVFWHSVNFSDLEMFNRDPSLILYRDNPDSPPTDPVLLGGLHSPNDTFEDSQGIVLPQILNEEALTSVGLTPETSNSQGIVATPPSIVEEAVNVWNQSVD